MPRLYRPTGMRKYRPFSGAGGELLSASGGSSVVGSDDFESYSTGDLFTVASGTWAHARTAAGYQVVTGQHVDATNSVDGLDGIYNSAMGNGYTDGTVSGKVTISNGGHANTQPGLLARWVTVDNFVWASLNNGFNNLVVASYIGGVSSQTTVAQSWSRGTAYWMDLILSGASCTANVYSDAAKTTLVNTVTHTNCYTGSGYMGFVTNAQATGQAFFDDWSFTT